jgi:hypothetical protein
VRFGFTITAERGTLSGYFAPQELIQEALDALVMPILPWRLGNKKTIFQSVDSGFHSAYDLVNYSYSNQKPKKQWGPYAIRYLKTPVSPERIFSLAPYNPIVCDEKFDLKSMKHGSELTIIEDGVLIQILNKEEPELVGTLLRNLAVRSRGIVIIGKHWIAPVENLEPWLDRLGWIYEQPMIGEGKKIIPEFGQKWFE